MTTTIHKMHHLASAALRTVSKRHQLAVAVLTPLLMLSACSTAANESSSSLDQTTTSGLGSASLRAASSAYLAGLEGFTGSSETATWQFIPEEEDAELLAACSSPGVEAQQFGLYTAVPTEEGASTLVGEFVQAHVTVFSSNEQATTHVRRLNEQDAEECDQALWDTSGDPPGVDITPEGLGVADQLTVNQALRSDFPDLTTRQFNATVSANTVSEQLTINKVRFSRGRVVIELWIGSPLPLAQTLADMTLQALAEAEPQEAELEAVPGVDRKIAVYETFAKQNQPFPTLELELGSFVEPETGSECAVDASPTTAVLGPISRQTTVVGNIPTTSSLAPTAVLYPTSSTASDVVNQIADADPECFTFAPFLGSPTFEKQEFSTSQVDGRTVVFLRQDFSQTIGSVDLRLERVVVVVAAEAFVLYFKFYGLEGDSKGLVESSARLAADLEALL